MGRRRQRKLDRRAQQRSRERTPSNAVPMPRPEDVEQLFADLYAAEVREAERAEATCGRCREFVEDGEFGRGTCLHPASGVFAPWNDTPACAYFDRGRAASRTERYF